jgi:hypothetical protein
LVIKAKPLKSWISHLKSLETLLRLAFCVEYLLASQLWFPYCSLPFLWEALIASVIGTVATLFGVGAMKTIFSRRNWVRGGLEMMGIGASAAAITYVIGALFSMII